MQRPLCAVFAVLSLALVLSWGLPGFSPAFAADPWSLTILHTNDVHARLSEFDKAGRLCLEPAPTCAGGTARVAAAARAVRAAGIPSLLLDAGDQFLGTPYFTLFQGQASARLMNLAGYDAMALGNHELDAGTAALARFAASLSFPLLSANADTSDEPALQRNILPYAVVLRGGRKVGIIGATTPDTAFLAKDAGALRFDPVRPAVLMAVHELRAAGVDVIVCLSHLGYAEDKRLAASVAGLDVIVGGHSHTVLGDGPQAAGPYPTVVRSASGAPTLIVTDGKWGASIGELRVEFDKAGVPVSWSGAPRPLGPDAPADAEVLAAAAEYAAQLRAYMAVPVGTLRTGLSDGDKMCRFGPCLLGQVAADAVLAAARPSGARAALLNAGSLRAGLPAGAVTFGDLVTALPFGNTVALATYSGRDLLAALEHGVSRAAPDQREMGGTGRFLQVAGLRYTWTPDAEPGSRIISASVRGAGGGWEALDPKQDYRVAVSDYLLGGGDDFAMLRDGAHAAYDTSLPLTEALRRAIASGAPLPLNPDGRIVTVRTAN